jgi:O-antigen biosynthesis protein
MPVVSVVTAVHDPRPEHLRACLGSVAAQRSIDWQHVLVDDGSSDPAVRSLLAACAAQDPRVEVITRDRSGGIARAINDALDRATGTFVAFLDHDDVLDERALSEMVAALGEHGNVGYSDHDLLRPDGRFASPFYKPDFSPERLRSQNYVTHLLVVRRRVLDELGGLRLGFDGAQDHDLLLRLVEAGETFVHVPKLLYHWRQSPASVSSGDNKPWAFEAGVRVVGDHLARIGVPAAVELTASQGCYRVRRQVDERPLVSVIIPTRGSSGREWGVTRRYVVEAVRSMVEQSTYREMEFVVVHDDDTPAVVLDQLERIAGDALRLVPFSRPFNFSEKMNVGALAASGSLLLALNDDTELIEASSLEVLVGHLQTDGVAMAGAKLLYADGTLQHGGHVYHHDLMHTLHGWPGDSPGPAPLLPLAVERECSGVTAAAALIDRRAFEEVGGFAVELPLNYNDVDLCLKLRAHGHRIIWTPWASWYHFESRTRVSRLLPEEYDFVNRRWHYEINNDPYYNPNLAPNRADWLERPLRSGAAPVESRPAMLKRLAARFSGSVAS